MEKSELAYSWKDIVPVYGISRRVAIMDKHPDLPLKDYVAVGVLSLYHGVVSVPLIAGVSMGLETIVK